MDPLHARIIPQNDTQLHLLSRYQREFPRHEETDEHDFEDLPTHFILSMAHIHDLFPFLPEKLTR